MAENITCRYFLRGGCMRGDKCFYTHSETVSTCKEYQNNGCINSECPLLHWTVKEEAEFHSNWKRAPDKENKGREPYKDFNRGGRFKEREYCLDFSRGECFRGSLCKYMHTKHEDDGHTDSRHIRRKDNDENDHRKAHSSCRSSRSRSIGRSLDHRKCDEEINMRYRQDRYNVHKMRRSHSVRRPLCEKIYNDDDAEMDLFYKYKGDDYHEIFRKKRKISEHDHKTINDVNAEITYLENENELLREEIKDLEIEASALKKVNAGLFESNTKYRSEFVYAHKTDTTARDRNHYNDNEN